MLVKMTSPLRILLLLVMVLASTLGHHAAMAYSEEGAAASTAIHRASDRADACAAVTCGDHDRSCCIAGQCLLALNPRVYIAFRGKTAHPVDVTACPGPRAGPIKVPFRPPVA